MKKYVKADINSFRGHLDTLENLPIMNEYSPWDIPIENMMYDVEKLIEDMEHETYDSIIRRDYNEFQDSSKKLKEMVDTLISSTENAVNEYLKD